MDKVTEFIASNWEIITPIIYEVGARLIPTKRNISLLDNVLKIIGLLIKNRRKKRADDVVDFQDSTINKVFVERDRHIISSIIIALLVASSALAQQNPMNGTAVRLVNVNDSTSVTNNPATTNPANFTMFYNKQSGKPRMYFNGVGHDIATGTSTVTASNGLQKVSNDILPIVPNILNGPNPTSGAGTNASPFTAADGRAGIQTSVNLLTPSNGGKITIGPNLYSITSTNGITVDSSAIEFAGQMAGKLQNPNGEFPATRGSRLTAPNIVFDFRQRGTKRLSGVIRDIAANTPTAMQAASMNGSTGIGTKFIKANSLLEQSLITDAKANGFDFGFYYDSAGGTFHDVVNLTRPLFLHNRYGGYLGANATTVFNQYHNGTYADNVKHGFYYAANNQHNYSMLSFNVYARNSGAPGILDNAANLFAGFSRSTAGGNIVYGAGLDFYPTPTQYNADGMYVAGNDNSIFGTGFFDNQGAGPNYALRVVGDRNVFSGPVFAGNTAPPVRFESTADLNSLTGNPWSFLSPLGWQDANGTNIVNGFGQSAGDPQSVAPWNALSKPMDVKIYDNVNSVLYWYPSWFLNNNLNVRMTSNSFAFRNIGTAAGDVAAMGVGNTTHTVTLQTTTAAAAVNPLMGILNVSAGATNGAVLAVGAGSINMSTNGGTTLGNTFSNSAVRLGPLAGSGTRMVVADASGNLATQTISSATIAGSIASNQVGFGSGANTLAGSNKFQWNDGVENLLIQNGGGTATSNFSPAVWTGLGNLSLTRTSGDIQLTTSSTNDVILSTANNSFTLVDGANLGGILSGRLQIQDAASTSFWRFDSNNQTLSFTDASVSTTTISTNTPLAVTSNNFNVTSTALSMVDGSTSLTADLTASNVSLNFDGDGSTTNTIGSVEALSINAPAIGISASAGDMSVSVANDLGISVTANASIGADGTLNLGGQAGAILQTLAGQIQLVTSSGNISLQPGTNGDINLQANSGSGTYLIVTGLPTGCGGAPAGALWNDAGTLKICP